jgi:competence ComEA-like helix-hairpin-helix protein
MRPLAKLRERFRFTRSETAVILFLSLTFCAGNAVRWYKQVWGTSPAIPRFDYRAEDSEFVARSRALLYDSPSARPPSSSSLKQEPALHSIDLNAATSEQLILLPGIGKATAEKILEYRSRYGPFSSLDQLKNVKGIGTKKFLKIKPFLKPVSAARDPGSE